MNSNEIINIVHQIDELEEQRDSINEQIKALKTKLGDSANIVLKKKRRLKRQNNAKQEFIEYVTAHNTASIADIAKHIYGEITEVSRARVRSIVFKLKANKKLAGGPESAWVVQ